MSGWEGNRRRFLSTAGTAAMLATAGCLEFIRTEENTTETPTVTDNPTDAAGTEETAETTEESVDGPLRIDWEERFDNDLNHISLVQDDVVAVVTEIEEVPIVTTIATEDGSAQTQFELPGWMGSETIWQDEDSLVGCSSGSVYVQDWQTGEVLQETSIDGVPYALSVLHETAYVGLRTWDSSSDGVSQYGKLKAFDLSDLSTRWTIETDATVNTRPLVTADRIFLTVSENKDEGALYVYDRETREHLWSREAPTAFRAGPIVDDGTIFAGTRGNYNNSAPPTELVALDPTDGSTIWERTDDERLAVNGRLNVVDGDLIVDSHFAVERIDRSDGSTIWRTEMNYGIPSGIHVQGDAVYFGTTQGNLYAIEIEDGRERWQYRTGGRVSSLTVDGETLYWTRGPDLLRGTIV